MARKKFDFDAVLDAADPTDPDDFDGEVFDSASAEESFGGYGEEVASDDDIFEEADEGVSDGDRLVPATAPLLEIPVAELRRALAILGARPRAHNDYTSSVVRMIPSGEVLEMWTTNGLDYTSIQIDAKSRGFAEPLLVHIQQLQKLLGLKTKTLCLTIEDKHLYAATYFGHIFVPRYSIPNSHYDPGLGATEGEPEEVESEALLRACSALSKTVKSAEQGEYANLFFEGEEVFAINEAISTRLEGAFPHVVVRKTDISSVAAIAKHAEGKVSFQMYEDKVMMYAPSIRAAYIWGIVDLTAPQEHRDVLLDAGPGYTVETAMFKRAVGLVNGLPDFEEYVDLHFEDGELRFHAPSKRQGSTDLRLSDLFDGDVPAKGILSVSLSVLIQALAAHATSGTVEVYLSDDQARLLVSSEGVKTSARGLE